MHPKRFSNRNGRKTTLSIAETYLSFKNKSNSSFFKQILDFLHTSASRFCPEKDVQICSTCATYKTLLSLAFIKSPAKLDLSLWHGRHGKPQDGNLLLPQAKQATLEKAGGKWQEEG